MKITDGATDAFEKDAWPAMGAIYDAFERDGKCSGHDMGTQGMLAVLLKWEEIRSPELLATLQACRQLCEDGDSSSPRPGDTNTPYGLMRASRITNNRLAAARYANQLVALLNAGGEPPRGKDEATVRRQCWEAVQAAGPLIDSETEREMVASIWRAQKLTAEQAAQLNGGDDPLGDMIVPEGFDRLSAEDFSE